MLFALFLTVQLWTQQRGTYERQFLERARAVRLALDTQIDGILRTLRATGDSAEIPASEAETVIQRRFRRLLDNYPGWVSVVLLDAKGRELMATLRPDTAVAPRPDAADIGRTLASGTSFVSGAQTTPGGLHVVFVGTAIMHGGQMQGMIYATIEHAHWLELLRMYPVSQRGTLTLVDRKATVIARTLNDPQWVGKQAPTSFWQKTIDQTSGAFTTTSLDDTSFYAAFSRSAVSGWVLAAGVPRDEVDEALYGRTAIVLLGSAAAICGALLAAWRLGKRISVALHGLADTASALAQKLPLPDTPLPIREARAVKAVLLDAHAQLLMREAMLTESVEREAAAREQAESGSRAKDQFLAMMGHELRNPLSAITAAIDLLGTDVLPDVSAHTREIARRQAGHLAGMINDLMDVAQLDSGNIVLRREILDLAQIASKVRLRFEETGRSAHLQMRVEHTPAWIDADAARVELLLTCLLDNACKYTPAGGTVTVLVRAEADTSTIRITDTGAGIAPDMLSSMFDRFTQGVRGIERSEGGLGLGLALARRLVDLHGGVITASSDGLGRGASFAVTFPRAATPQATVLPTPPDRDILLTVVEDINDTRDMMVMLLEAKGRRVNAASDGPSGVRSILEGPSDVAVVDIGLPGFDGMEVARLVRQSDEASRILLIALTGYGTESDRKKALAAGFDRFLVKPFDPDSLEHAIAEGLRGKQAA